MISFKSLELYTYEIVHQQEIKKIIDVYRTHIERLCIVQD